ncbi:2-hydroxy-3-oxopropionate reductase [Rhodocyclaceae bacterium]
MNIGFIGLGGMGRPMVERLLAAGYALTVWSRRPTSADFLPPAVVRAASPVELARQCDIVCTNVTGTTDVEALAAQLIDGLAPDSIHVDFSTIAPSAARAMAARYAARGSHFVDAPVSGGTAGAQAATLAIMWGGRQALAPRLDPLFRCLGKTIVHVGAAGAGQVAKACNQLVMVAAIEACAEAAYLAQAAGVDFDRVRTALLGGSAASRVLDVFGGRMAARDFMPGVEARLHHKDFAAVLAEAMQQAIPLPVASTVLQQLDALMMAGWGHDDSARLLSVLERAGRGS